MTEYTLLQGLPAWSQADALAHQGTALAQRTYQDWTITLYAFNNYFVERWLKPELTIMGTFAKTAPSLAILEPYTNAIALQDFLNS